jgi:hypothetical protein
MPQRSHRWYWILLGFVAVLGLAHACQKDNPVQPGPAANVRIAQVEAERYLLGPDDSTRIRAWVVEGPEPGTPVPGAAAVYSEMPDLGAGTFTKTETTADAGGWATTVYRASGNALGLVTLRVQVGSSIKYLMLEVRPATQNATTLDLATPAGQTGLPADGTSELEISVSVATGEARTPVAGLPLVLAAGDGFTDTNGNGIHDAGEPVPFGQDRNGNGVWDAEGGLPEQVVTDDHGAASFHYRAGETVGPVYVRVTGAGVFQELTLQQHSLTLVVTLEAVPQELLADGVSQAAVTVRVQDWAGVPAWGNVLRCTAGEPFTDANGNGFYDSPNEAYEDLNANGHWDAIGSVASSATTNADGMAVLTYTAGLDPGVVTLRATTSNGFGTTTLRLVPVPPARRLAVTLDQAQAYADGAQSVGGTVTVTDLDGGGLAGKAVTVVAGERFEDVNADGLFTVGIDRLLDDADGNQAWTPAGVVTVAGPTGGVNGTARFELVVGTVPMQAWVHAAVDGVVADAPLELLARPPVSSVALEAQFAEMTVSGGGGVTRNPLTAACLTAQSVPPPTGTIVSFRVAAGPGGGERLENAVGGRVDALTGADGRATAVLLSGTRSGGVRVSATCAGVSGSVEVYVAPGGTSSVTCAADSTRLTPGNQSAVRAWVYDAARNPVADGTPVRFRADKGLVGPAEVPTMGGVAAATFTALPGDAGLAHVTVSCTSGSGGVVECSKEIQIREPDPPSAVYLTCAADSLVLGAGNQCRIRTLVFDAAHNPVIDGTTVSFTVDEGVVQGTDGPAVSRTLNGVAEANFTAPIAVGGGVASVVASTAAASGGALVCTSDITIREPNPVVATYLTCAADSAQLTPAGQCRVWALVFDAAHNPVANGTPVTFSVDEGVVQGAAGPGVSLTQSGLAEAIFTAPSTSVDGVAQVLVTTPRATGGDLQCSSEIRISGGFGMSCNVTLEPALPEIGVRGTGATEQTLLRARVYDCRNMPVGAGEQVAFVIAAGPGGGEAFIGCECDSVVSLTDATGTAEITLRAGTRSGSVEVRARALSNLGVSAHSPVAIAAGPPAYLSVGVEKCNVLTCRTVAETNPGVALAYDAYHNPVRDGTVVYFTANYGMVRGRLELGSSTTQRGEAPFEWLSTGWPECGIVNIAASTSGGGLTATGSFIGSGPAYSATFVVPSDAMVSLSADGATELPLRVQLLDANGLYVLPTSIELVPIFGTIAPPEPSADGCNASIARATYVAPILTRDFSDTTPDDGIGAIDVVRVLGGFGPQGDTLRVQLLTGPASASKSTVEIATTMRVNDQTFFTITVKDLAGNPLGGHRLTIAAPGATVTAEGTTDSYGVVGGLSFTAPAVAGSVYLEVRDVDPAYSGNMILRKTVTVSP